MRLVFSLWFLVSFVSSQTAFPGLFPQYCSKTALLNIDATISSSIVSSPTSLSIQDQAVIGRARFFSSGGTPANVASATKSLRFINDGYLTLLPSDGRAVGQFAVHPSNPLTFGAWVQPTSCPAAPYAAHILNLGQGSTALPYLFVGIDSSCHLVLGYGTGNADTTSLSRIETRATGNALTPNQWNFISASLVNNVATLTVIPASGAVAGSITGSQTTTPTFTALNYTAGASYTLTTTSIALQSPVTFLASNNFIGKSQYATSATANRENFQGYIANVQLYSLDYTSFQTRMYNPSAAAAGGQSDTNCGVVGGSMASLTVPGFGGNIYDFQAYNYPLLMSTGVDILKNVTTTNCGPPPPSPPPPPNPPPPPGPPPPPSPRPPPPPPSPPPSPHPPGPPAPYQPISALTKITQGQSAYQLVGCPNTTSAVPQPCGIYSLMPLVVPGSRCPFTDLYGYQYSKKKSNFTTDPNQFQVFSATVKNPTDTSGVRDFTFYAYTLSDSSGKYTAAIGTQPCAPLNNTVLGVYTTRWVSTSFTAGLGTNVISAYSFFLNTAWNTTTTYVTSLQWTGVTYSSPPPPSPLPPSPPHPPPPTPHAENVNVVSVAGNPPAPTLAQNNYMLIVSGVVGGIILMAVVCCMVWCMCARVKKKQIIAQKRPKQQQAPVVGAKLELFL